MLGRGACRQSTAVPSNRDLFMTFDATCKPSFQPCLDAEDDQLPVPAPSQPRKRDRGDGERDDPCGAVQSAVGSDIRAAIDYQQGKAFSQLLDFEPSVMQYVNIGFHVSSTGLTMI